MADAPRVFTRVARKRDRRISIRTDLFCVELRGQQGAGVAVITIYVRRVQEHGGTTIT